MNCKALKEGLFHQHLDFITYVDGLTEEQFLATPNEKWSAGQQMEHIYMSIRPIPKLVANKPVMQERFGMLDRASRSYEGLVADYLQVLSGGAKAGPRFTPETTPFVEKANLIAEIKKDITSIASHLNDYSEEELDQFVIPHPVMGPFSLREMMMFTIYHVQHHLKSIQENLNGATSSD